MKQSVTMSFAPARLCLYLALIALSQQLSGQALPAWSDEDRARLKRGEIIPGAILLIDELPAENKTPQPAPDPEVPSLPEVVPEPPYDPELIPDVFLSDYFSKSPSGYLIDPQKLFSRQEGMDREGFLAYHAVESEVEIRLYLFDAQQVIPDQYTLQELAQEQYSDTELTAVVFCFLGDPSRNQLAFGGKLAGELETLEIRRILESALLKGMEKSEPAAQVEAFVIQLSIKLYWMEQTLIKNKDEELAGATTANKTPTSDTGREASGEPAGIIARLKPYFLYMTVAGGSLLLIVIGIVGIFLLWKKNRRYHFPVLDMPRRLGADYAAGVGAVIAFHNKYGSPSNQRDQVPDYLT